jgi:hypothetical protein
MKQFRKKIDKFVKHCEIKTSSGKQHFKSYVVKLKLVNGEFRLYLIKHSAVCYDSYLKAL